MNEIEFNKQAWMLITRQALPADVNIPMMEASNFKERAIRHVYDTAIQPFLASPGALFEAMNKAWLAGRLNRDDQLHGLALAHAHNIEQINGLQIAVTAIEEAADLFTVIRMLADALPAFEKIDVSALIQFFEVVYPRTKNDLANGLPYNAVEQWLIFHPDRVDEVLSACLAHPSPALAALLRIVLLRTVASQQAKGLATIHRLRSSENKYVALPAIEALGMLDWTIFDRAQIDQALEALRGGLMSPDDDIVISSSLAAMWLVKSSPEDHIVIDEILALDKPFIVRIVSDQFAYRTEIDKWIPDKIMLLAGKTRQNPGSYSGVDYILSSFLESTDASLDSAAWLDAWALAAAGAGDEISVPKFFPHLFSALSKDQDRLSKLVIGWVMHPDLGIQKAAREIMDGLMYVNHPELRVPRAMLDQMSEPELVHLVRRVLGNVLRGDQMVSLIWSMTDTQSAESRTYGLVHEAIVNHVGYNYPHATKAYLQPLTSSEEDSPLRRLAHSATNKINNYLSEIDVLPRIEELKSPDEHHRSYQKSSQRVMNKAYEEANRGSFIELIATKIPLKAGRSSFSRRGGKVGEKMHLSSFTHSITLPRSESIDNVGSAIERFYFQIAKVGEK